MSLIDGIKLLNDLSKQEKDDLSLFCQEKIIHKGETLFNEGDEATAMYLLKRGSIDIFKKMKGTNVSIGNVTAEEILGEMALFGDTNKRMATAIAKEDSRLLILLSFSIKELANKHPQLMEKIQQIINLRLISNKNINN